MWAQPNTLEYLGNTNLPMLGTDMQLFPPNDPHFRNAAAALTTTHNTDIDVFPPGFREQMLNPPFTSGPHVSSLLYNQRLNNAAPLFNYDQHGLGIFDSVENQRFGAYMHKILVTDQDKLRDINKDLGQWSAQATGFSALHSLRAHSTMKWI
jgi:hypothetical protein